jgi:molecular chaperone HscB
MDDPFAVLGLERQFDVDLKAAEKNHRELSRALHPDRYASAGPSEKREALSRAVEVNEAWRVVRDPIRRAEALFRLAGVTAEPKASPALLMEMMERREMLETAKAARDLVAVHRLADAVEQRANRTEAALADAFRTATNGSLAEHAGTLGELRFYRRFLEEVSAIEDEVAHG